MTGTFHPRPGGGFGGRADEWLRIVPVVLLVILLFVAVGSATVTVGAGERAAVFNKLSGVKQTQLDEGLHFVWPFIEQPVVYDVKTATYTMSGVQQEGEVKGNDALSAVTADGQTVSLDISVRYHVDPTHVWRLHQRVGPGYPVTVIRPQVRCYTRMVVSGFPVTDVYSGRRAVIQEQVKARLAEAFKENDIVLDDVLLRDVRFSQAFQQSIEDKQVAQQEAQAMQYILDRARQERDRKVIEAEGAAQSIRLKAQALAQNPQLVQYEYVQRLPEKVPTVIADSRTIINFGDLFGTAPAAAGKGEQR